MPDDGYSESSGRYMRASTIQTVLPIRKMFAWIYKNMVSKKLLPRITDKIGAEEMTVLLGKYSERIRRKVQELVHKNLATNTVNYRKMRIHRPVLHERIPQ